MPNVAAFNSDNPANPYMEGEVNLGMIWNGSAFVARQAGTPIDVVWPKEGGISGWTAWRSRQMPKQRRRAEIDQLPAAPGCGKTGC